MQSAPQHSQVLGLVPAAVLDSISDLVAAVDTGLRLIAINERYRSETERLLGVSFAVGQKLDDGLAHFPEHQQRARELWARALSGEPFTITLAFDSEDGEQHFECRYSPLRDASGNIVGAMHIARNVTSELLAARQAAAALEREQHAHARLNAVLDSISDAFIAVDARWQVTHLNLAAEQMLSLQRTEILGRDLRDHLAIPPLNEQRRVSFRRNGCIIEIDAAPGGAHGSLLWFRDITDRKGMEEQLRRAREQFAIAAAATRALVYDWDLETGHVERVCGFKELTGWEPAEVLPTADWWRDQCHPEDLARFLENPPDLIPGQPRSAEYRIRRKDGSYIVVRDTAVLFASPEGKLVRSVGSTVDITQQRAAEAALHESEERFRTIAEAMPHNAYIASHDGTVEYVNSQLLEFTGLPLASFHRDIWSVLIHPEDYDTTRAAWNSAALQGSTIQMEFRVRGTGGRWRWMLHRMVPLRSSGSIVRWLGTLTDIHDRHTAEEALRASESQLRQTADALPQLVWVSDDAGHDDWHNKRWLEYTGATPADLRGDRWSDFIHPDDRDLAWQRWQSSLSTGQPYEILYRIRRYDGEYRWMLGRAVPIYDERGVIGSWFGTCTDVHEQKRLEEALRASEQQLQLALSAAQLGIWNFDPTTGRVNWDLRTREIFGVGPYDPVDYDSVVHGIIHPDDRDRAHAAAQRALSPDGTGRYVIEHRIVSPQDGTTRWLMVSGRVFFEGEAAVRKAVSMTGTVADITDRKQIEEALIRSNQDLERFAYMASHDLREPLRAVRMFAELLYRRYQGKLDATADQYLDFLMSGTARMSRLIDDLLAFGRITADAELTPGPVDCKEALESALTALQSAVAETAADVDSDPLPVVYGFSGLIPQLFQNLIGNAIKYRRPGIRPRIHIGAVPQHGSWLLSVRDNGAGFAPEDASRIFSVFTRLNREHGSGSGLGLAICQRIVERHHGRIWAESEPGVGSTFWFTLPALDSSSARTG